MIQQFDVFANPDANEAAYRPFLVVLQSDLVSDLRATVVAPLVRRQDMTGAQRLTPLVTVGGEEFWLATHELFALDRRILRKKIASLAQCRDQIIAALDMLFTGFLSLESKIYLKLLGRVYGPDFPCPVQPSLSTPSVR